MSRRGPSPRLLVDLAGLAPIVGEPVDAINGAVYLGQGQWIDGLLSIAGAIPGPLGWAATGGRIGKSLDEADDVVSSVVRTDDEILATIRDRSDALQARHVDARLVGIYRERRETLERLEPLDLPIPLNGGFTDRPGSSLESTNGTAKTCSSSRPVRIPHRWRDSEVLFTSS